MSKAKKFGAFGGVFTPSLLTILGVIMYLRLGWVVGNSGLLGSLIIILIAHVISISTGLSVSSVATDRKVKAGGLYYMLSRSLGLPIGGSIGIALFFATALSISMYIVGFSENFNETVGITTPGMGIAEKVQTYRLTGTITLVIITAIALISTSLAIKAQYYIMAAIGLSLISIFAGGFFIEHEFAATSLQLFAAEGSVNYETVFGIFFPAVTGFTAGVAMSGDLKDPKKAIPIGTMAAIGVGLVVYLSLAIFLSLSIDGAVLRDEQRNAISEITLFSYLWPKVPILFIAGVWGATLSSALGGILGGPRILQAMSVDRITPILFAKGVGETNEPRNALILTFVIAEAGVLVGDLNTIAPTVSMFYLTAYGFINLTSALESWTGSDFRPQFRIPRAVSVIGAVATFTVMSQIGLWDMIVSFIIIGAIFFYLTKQQLNLGFSNIWQGVWAELVRIGLFRLDKKIDASDRKNWRPNILLFSGDKTKRSHLVSFGQALVGRLGVVSSFELEEKITDQPVLTKADQAIEAGQSPGMFFRKYQCNNIYEGIGIIAETFGFSGIDPNTVLLGWARYSKSPLEFTRLVKRFHKLDYNILIMDYDQRYGFGQYNTVDVWWNGEERHISFALTMLRFLTAGEDWRKSQVRLFIMLDKTRINSMEVYKRMEDALEELRIYASVKIVDNDKGNKALYDAIRIESNKADLIFIELPKIKENGENSFFEDTDALCKDIGTVVLYRGSSRFNPIEIGLSDVASKIAPNSLIQEEISGMGGLMLPRQEALSYEVKNIHQQMAGFIDQYHLQTMQPIVHDHSLLLQSLKKNILHALEQWKALEGDAQQQIARGYSINQTALQEIQQVFQTYADTKVKVHADGLYKSKQEVIKQIQRMLRHLPKRYAQRFGAKYLKEITAEQMKNFSPWRRFWAKKLQLPLIYIHPVRRHIEEVLVLQGSEIWLDWARRFMQDASEWGDYLHDIERQTARLLRQANEAYQQGNSIDEATKHDTTELLMALDTLASWDKHRLENYRHRWHIGLLQLMQRISFSFDSLLSHASEPRWRLGQRLRSETVEELWGVAPSWAANQQFFFNRLALDTQLDSVKQHIIMQIGQARVNIHQTIQEHPLFDIEKLSLEFENYLTGNLDRLPQLIAPRPEWYFLHQQITGQMLVYISDIINRLPHEITLLNEEMMLSPEQNEVKELDSIHISPQAVSSYIFQTTFTEPLMEEIEVLSSLIEEAIEAMQSTERLVGISLKNTGEAMLLKEGKEREGFQVLIKEEHERLSEIYKQMSAKADEVVLLIDKLTGDVAERLDAYGLVKSASQMDAFLRTRSRERVLNRFAQYWSQFRGAIYHRITDWRYDGWRGPSTPAVMPNTRKTHADAEELLPFMASIRPSRSTEEALPFYYKQLFASEQSTSMELWVGREQELHQASNAIAYHDQGYGGAVLVTGGYLAGKTLLAEKITEAFLQKRRILHVRPPETGSPDLKVFRKSFNQAMGGYNYRLDTIMERILPEGTVVILHDIELWWERASKGYEVIERIEELISNYGQQVLFIATINHHTLSFWQKSGYLESCFTQIIRCLPLHAKELREVILSRHHSTHMRYRLDGTHEEDVTPWKQAGFFSDLFDCARGNVGVALQTWMSAITGVNKHEVEVTTPQLPDYDIFARLSPVWVAILLQFVLHKHLTADKLARVMQADLPSIQKKIKILERMGLLKDAGGIWEIDRYVAPYLIRFLEEREVLG